MKRPSSFVAGMPAIDDRRHVAGSPPPSHVDLDDVATFLANRVESAPLEAQVANDFAEFLAGDRSHSTTAPLALDPDFRERLRRRLWRLHLIARSGWGWSKRLH